jgi:hypothetical protein
VIESGPNPRARGRLSFSASNRETFEVAIGETGGERILAFWGGSFGPVCCGRWARRPRTPPQPAVVAETWVQRLPDPTCQRAVPAHDEILALFLRFWSLFIF